MALAGEAVFFSNGRWQIEDSKIHSWLVHKTKKPEQVVSSLWTIERPLGQSF
jgi:hypothetical protein